jgi:hypothetical protein
MPLDEPNTWTLSRIIGILSFIATALTLACTYFAALIPPDVAVILLGVAAAISAFTGRIQGSN